MRSQVSFFAIAGLLLLIFIAFFLYAASRTGTSVSLNTDSTHQYMESCLKAHAEEGVKKLGVYSGRLDGKTSKDILSIEESQLLFNEYMVERVPICVENYPIPGTPIATSNPTATTILASSVIIRMDGVYVSVSDNTARNSEPFDIEIPVRYKTIRDAAVAMQYSDYIEDSGALQTKGFDIGATEYEGGELWLIADSYSTIQGPFYFAFLN